MVAIGNFGVGPAQLCITCARKLLTGFAQAQLGTPICRRNPKGNTAEFAPVLIFLLVFMIFPLIAMLYLGAAFACGYFLNHEEIRELAARSPDQATTALSDVDTKFVASPFAQLIRVTDTTAIIHDPPIPPATAAYDPSPGTDPGDPNTNGIGLTKFETGFVKLTTRVTVPPFLTNSPDFLGHNVPGLTASMTFAFSDRRPQEDKGFN